VAPRASMNTVVAKRTVPASVETRTPGVQRKVGHFTDRAVLGLLISAPWTPVTTFERMTVNVTEDLIKSHVRFSMTTVFRGIL
jgi:hypothetical protein